MMIGFNCVGGAVATEGYCSLSSESGFGTSVVIGLFGVFGTTGLLLFFTHSPDKQY